ncbi:MAG TPA: prolyl oligopeptidase family serine peptidase [Kofleriaceae bacterium]|nr:prolyl oligopeptidase family serine peptidase [Kofleriaceae bacterium]
MRALICAVFAACASAQPPPPVPAPLGPGVPRKAAPMIREVPHFDVVAGMLIDDPFRWLEGAPPFADSAQKTLEAQARYARRTLAAIAEQRTWMATLAKDDRAAPRIVVEAVTGTEDAPRFFLSELPPERDTYLLYVRDGVDGRDRLLIDPARLDEPGHRHSIDALLPSPDGAKVAYSIQDNGNEHGAIEIADVETGLTLDDRIAARGAFSWRADGGAIFYAWARAVWQHELGTPQTSDKKIFDGAGYGATDLAVYGYPDSGWDVAIAGAGVSRGSRVLVARAVDVAQHRATWREVAAPDDIAVQVFAHGDTIYVLTGAGAPTRRVVALDARTGTMKTARELIAAGPDAIEAIAPSDDGLYLALRSRGAFHLARVPWTGGAPARIPQPVGTSVAWFQTRTHAPVIFEVDAWTRGPSWHAYDPALGTTDLALAPVEEDPDTIVEEQDVVSRDGTRVPLTILHGQMRSREAPAIVEGYGSYGISAAPSYDRAVRAWIARGGVWAYCDTRGGGGWLTPWHQAGIKTHKEDAVDDFLACAQALVDRGDTQPARLTAYSYSSGGVLIGGAITRRPELFAAAILRSPIADLVRARALATGRYNESEYGDPRDPIDLRALVASDPYHRVQRGVAYPGVLFSIGAEDARVANWQAAKLAARLDHCSTSGRAVLVRVDPEAGHTGGDRAQQDAEWADLFAFARWQSGLTTVR